MSVRKSIDKFILKSALSFFFSFTNLELYLLNESMILNNWIRTESLLGLSRKLTWFYYSKREVIMFF